MLEAESERPHHRKALRKLVNQLQPVFDGSAEGVFIYLDDEHKACNDLLADMFGYSPMQWADLQPFEKLFSKESKSEVKTSYYESIIAEKSPVELSFKGVRKDGSSFKARLFMVPITCDNILFALGFIKQAE